MELAWTHSWFCLSRLLASLAGPLVFALVVVAAEPARPAADGESRLFLSCAARNDLYLVMQANGIKCARYDSPARAVAAAAEGMGVLVLADGYPEKTSIVSREVFAAAARKKVRLYVEYPAELPGLRVGGARAAALERAVATSSAFGPALKKLDLVAIHDCHFVVVEGIKEPLLGLATVAGFDTAACGLDDVTVLPLLFEVPQRGILVSTTKLSQFVTGRYATKPRLQAIWRLVLGWLQPGSTPITLEWTPTVRPTYTRDARLPADAAKQAIVRGLDWHSRARMLLQASWKDRYSSYRADGTVKQAVGPRPSESWPAGDGEWGVLEGVTSRIQFDGYQPVRWWLRSDSIGESALAFALRSRLDGDPRSRVVASNLLDFVYSNSGLFQNDPAKANFGLLHWAPDNTALYGDNDIKVMLGCMGTAALLETGHWDEVLLQNILGNFRTTGRQGFRTGALSEKELLRDGWQAAWQSQAVNYAPHYEAWVWASYLWLYHQTGYRPLLARTRNAIRLMMEAYPERWRWTNGIQQERGRMLLPLAWLVRVEDRPEYRAWLKRLASDMQKCQVDCGAIREELGALGNGRYPPPRSNAGYGKEEAPLIQQNGDPVADLLYTCNFTFLGLHEAFGATGDPQYKEMADKLAEFLIRIQVRSETHPELDGAWFRAFDFSKWDYWGSNADSGWGAWSVEVGWTQGWVPTVLALRELKLNLWDLTKDSTIQRHWEKNRRLMLTEPYVPLSK